MSLSEGGLRETSSSRENEQTNFAALCNVSFYVGREGQKGPRFKPLQFRPRGKRSGAKSSCEKGDVGRRNLEINHFSRGGEIGTGKKRAADSCDGRGSFY